MSDGEALLMTALRSIEHGLEPLDTLSVWFDWLQEEVGDDTSVVLKPGPFRIVVYRYGEWFNVWGHYDRSGDDIPHYSLWNSWHIPMDNQDKHRILLRTFDGVRELYWGWANTDSFYRDGTLRKLP